MSITGHVGSSQLVTHILLLGQGGKKSSKKKYDILPACYATSRLKLPEVLYAKVVDHKSKGYKNSLFIYDSTGWWVRWIPLVIES